MCSSELPIQISEHEGEHWMLENGVDLADFTHRLLGVGSSDDGFEQRSPENRVWCDVVRFIQTGVSSGLLQPEF